MRMPGARRALALPLVLIACESPRESDRAPAAPSGVVTPPSTAAAFSDTAKPVDLRPRYRTIGRAALSAEVRAWNIDVNGSGNGLPRGHGTYSRGARVFAERCALCHGARGEGIPPNPQLVSGPPDRARAFASDLKLPRTIGSYWPYATTLYDYINRAMPFTAPGSLPPDDVYSVIAFLLAENRVTDTALVIDARSLPRVRMPARDLFVVDDRKGGATFR